MLHSDELKQVLARKDLVQFEKVLCILALAPARCWQVKDIKDLGKKHGLRKIEKWNVSSALSEAYSRGLATRADEGWEILDEGINYLKARELIAGQRPAVQNVAAELRREVALVSGQNTQSFLIEAVECFEQRLFRAAVVLSWIGSVSLLHKYILADSSTLDAFNREASKRFSNSKKWQRPVKNEDDFGQLSESEQLLVMEKSSIIGKNVKQELEKCLDLRNGCGHPNSLVIGENRVAAHLEALIQNIFRKFSI